MILEVIKFAGVGLIATLLQYAAFFFFAYLFPLNPTFDSVFAYVVGGLASYLLNFNFTFSKGVNHIQAFPRFLTALAIGSFVNGMAFFWANRILENNLISLTWATAVTFICNYTTNKRWVYADRR